MSTTASLEEARIDISELEKLLSTATRPRVRECLVKEMDQLQKEIKTLEKKAQGSTNGVSVTPTQTVPQGYTENLTNYAWDQSDKFMKLYLSLDNLKTISDENVQAEYTEKSVTVKVKFPNKTSQLHIARLCEQIVPTGCYCKIKSDYVLVMLKKAEIGKTWPWVTEREKKSKEVDTPKMDETEDPSAGITKLMKKMYDEGDDEMKRTISKAFYESQMKQGQGSDPMAGL